MLNKNHEKKIANILLMTIRSFKKSRISEKKKNSNVCERYKILSLEVISIVSLKNNLEMKNVLL